MTVTFAQHPSPDNKKRPHKDLCGSANLTAGITRFSAAVHTSGVAEPSEADKHITQRLKSALAIIDVRVLDHFVVGIEDVFSFAEHGLI
jgi:DNA repair protein RadC